MFRIFKIALLTLIAMCTIFVSGFFIVLGWYSPSCGEDSEAVAFVRSLSEERLGKLYFDFESLSKSANVQPVYSSYGDGESLPSQFLDLKIVKMRPSRGYILVEGCMDHGVVMSFDGLKKRTKKKITLSWGEVPPDSGHEVIWVER
ncbi:hypothetical protein [uncultured Microbulbifer sp.]|uniref:hypothetical protein n=1 Tax=uncultured Microbulbifer sp. TaxID=348147 RepID=UPI0026323AAB|nr:hypothetical protein [uncultured Microbulbifer sp.]